jgi:hypothetical protein
MLIKKHQMKKVALALIIMLGISTVSTFSQEISYEIKIKYHKEKVNPTADVSIKVNKGTPSFNFYLMTNDPINGQILKESNPVNAKSYTFESVESGKYFIKIMDHNGMVAGKTIEITQESK